MPIYRSTLNTNKKPKKEKPVKEKMPFEKKKRIAFLILLLFEVCCFISLLFNNPIRSVFLGILGIFAYPFFLFTALMTIMALSKNKYRANRRYIISLSFSLFFIIVIVHLILTRNVSMQSYGKYLVETYQAKTTGAGIILSLLTYPIVKYLTVVGAYVFSIIGLVISIGFVIDTIVVARNTPEKEIKPESKKYDFLDMKTLNDNSIESITFEHKQEDLKKKIAKQKLGLESSESSIISSSMPIEDISSKMPIQKPMTKREYILTPPDIVIPEYPKKKEEKVETKKNYDDVILSNADSFYGANEIKTKERNIFEEQKNVSDISSHENTFSPNTNIFSNSNYPNSNNNLNSNYPNLNDNSNENRTINSNYNGLNNSNLNNSTPNNSNISNETDINSKNEYEDFNRDEIDDEDLSKNDDENIDYDFDEMEEDYNDEPENIEEDHEEIPSPVKNFNNTELLKNYDLGDRNKTYDIKLPSDVESNELRPAKTFEYNNNVMEKSLVKEDKPKERKRGHFAPYVKPPTDLLKYIENVDVVTDEECNENIEKLEQVLSDFKIPAKVKAVQVGPAVTRYEIGMPTGISVKKVQMHSDDIAMALASNGSIRIEAPIPGKNSVGIEVPNKSVSAVSLREMIESEDFQKRVNPMSFVLGKDINGNIQFCNLDKMPHLLVAGSTGSGKSVCLNTMLISMLYKSSPEDVRLILIDPKTVEFSVYANLPHLLTPHIITQKEEAINALNWAIKEMEYRYSLLQKYEVVNIKDYNNLQVVKDGTAEKLAYIVILIDELNDLMIDTKREMEDRIMKLAQKSRAAGIHLVIATQRPSVDVITGTIKANLPSRIAFALTNFADSKTVLDMGGAERLLGKGDMLFKPSDLPEPRRVQGAYVSSAEISAVVKFIKANNPSDFDDDTTKEITAVADETSNKNGADPRNNSAFDPVLKDALKWFIQANQASITMIQRRFGVGYARAARIIDQMEQNGFISTQDGSKPRQVLISMDDYNQLFDN